MKRLLAIAKKIQDEFHVQFPDVELPDEVKFENYSNNTNSNNYKEETTDDDVKCSSTGKRVNAPLFELPEYKPSITSTLSSSTTTSSTTFTSNSKTLSKSSSNLLSSKSSLRSTNNICMSVTRYKAVFKDYIYTYTFSPKQQLR